LYINICQKILKRHKRKIKEIYKISKNQGIESGFEICKDMRSGPIHTGTSEKMKFKKYCLYPLTYVHTHTEVTSERAGEYNVEVQTGNTIEQLPSLNDLKRAELNNHRYSCIISVPMKTLVCMEPTDDNIKIIDDFIKSLHSDGGNIGSKLSSRNSSAKYCKIKLHV